MQHGQEMYDHKIILQKALVYLVQAFHFLQKEVPDDPGLIIVVNARRAHHAMNYIFRKIDPSLRKEQHQRHPKKL